MMTKAVVGLVWLVGAALGLPMASAADPPMGLRVIISGGFAAAYQDLLPEFEQSTGIKVETSSGASEGAGPKTIRYELAHGAKADLVILSGEGLETLIQDGRILPGSKVGLATAPLAAAVRVGQSVPDIGTAAAFRRAVIAAGHVVMPGSTSGLFVRDKVLPKLELPQTVAFDLVDRGADVVEALRSGKADLAIGPTSELANQPGIKTVGELPGDLQLVQTFTAAVTSDAEHPELAERLIAFLSSDRASASLRKAGMKRP